MKLDILIAQMSARQVRYKSTAEVLDAVFALPSDPENSADDNQVVSDDGNASLDSYDSYDNSDDDVLYQLASDFDDSASGGAEDTDPDSSVEDENGWTKSVTINTSVDFDAVVVVPRHPFAPEERPVDFFGKLFDENIWTLLMNHTNLYAQQKNTRNWEAVTIDELKAFVGTLIGMGLHQVPTINHFWSSNPLFRVQHVANVMTVKRFKKILEALHVNDNSEMPKRGDHHYDKLFKVRPLLDLLNTAFVQQAVATTSQSIDEAMIKFKGRSTINDILTYMPMKPVKRGYKV